MVGGSGMEDVAPIWSSLAQLLPPPDPSYGLLLGRHAADRNRDSLPGGRVLMDNELVFDSQILYSDAKGKMQDISSKPIAAAARAKTMEAYLDITEVDPTTDAQVAVKWEKSADGQHWVPVGTLIDTDAGSAGAATVKVYDGDNGSELLGAYNRFYLGVGELNATPTTRVYVKASLRVVYKPF
jgi:hypothetical protein